MKITIYKNGKEWRTFDADEIDITTGKTLDEGALFLIKPIGEHGIIIDAEIDMQAYFGDNQITLTQPVS